jgi:predicted transcriptional regulator
MATRKRTISVRLDDRAKRRVEKAARLLKQSSGAFLEKAGEGRARKLLLEWAVSRYQRGEASFSELTDETGLSVEEIMEAVGIQGKEEALQMFLASCHTVAEARCNPEFLRLGQEAVKAISSAEE